ncbi:outer membrane protein [Rubritalea marina]|uniref:outer membrane protein n=1 Tax=Rubritalea marina TaxID=361055 RepID=UPI000371C665|nr:outer membrane beta-barrel protein [Rubritalea marina]
MKLLTHISTLTALALIPLAHAKGEYEQQEIMGEFQIGGGYFFEEETPYAIIRTGAMVNDRTSVGLQIGYAHRSEDYRSSLLNLDAKLDTFTLGGYLAHYVPIAESTSLYGSVGIGGAFSRGELSGSYLGYSGSGSDNDNSFYADATIGIEHKLSDNWLGNIGCRFFHLNQLEFSGLDLDPNTIMVGAELGLTYTF